MRHQQLVKIFIILACSRNIYKDSQCLHNLHYIVNLLFQSSFVRYRVTVGGEKTLNNFVKEKIKRLN